MKTHGSALRCLLLSSVLAAPLSHAASDFWNVDAAGNWDAPGNWLSGTQAPGSTTIDNTDVATFSNTITADLAVTVDATRYIGGISFENSSLFGFTLSGGALFLNDTGVIQTLANNGAHTDTISSPITISGASAATAFFTANATSASSLLSIGAVTGSASTGNTTTLTLNGTNTGANSVTGAISDGGIGGTLAVTKSGSGAWTLSGGNTFTGPVTITEGTLNAGSTTGFGTIAATASLTLGGAGTQGTLNYTAGATSSARNIVVGGAGGGVLNNNGAGLLTLSGTVSLASGPLTIGGANNVTIGSATATNRVSGGNALTKAGAGTLVLSNIGSAVAISGAMPINVTAGTLSIVKTNVASTNHLGTGLITITPGATVTFAQGGNNGTTYGNNIAIANAAGTANFTSTSGAVPITGTVTFNAGANVPVFKINNTNGTAGTMTFSGAFSGTGNVETNATAGGSVITLSGPQNQTGTISNVGAGGATVTISGAIGPGITGVTQNSATSQLTLSNAANTFTSAVTISQGQLNAGSVTGFGATAATANLTLGAASTQGTLNYTGGASSSARNIVVGGAGGGVINSTTGLLTLTGTVNLAGGPLTIGGANSVTIGSATATTRLSGTNALTKTGAGTLTLNTAGANAAISGAMPINVQQGTLQYTYGGTATLVNDRLGTGTITITPGATLGTSVGAITETWSNPISIPNTTATATISTSGGLVFSGPVTLAAGANTPTLRLTNTNGSAFGLTLQGAVSGPGNLQLNSTGTAAAITVSGEQNQTGTISNIGTTANNTSVSTLSGTIGSGITAISQGAGATNPFTVSASVPLSATLNTFTSSGSGLFSFTNADTFTGTQNLTFNANSTGGIAVSGTNLNHTGSVTNSGGGAGSTTISGAIGASVTDVIQNSATSILWLSGANSGYTAGKFTVTAGILGFVNTGAMTGYPTPAVGDITVASGATMSVGVYSGGFSAADVTNISSGTLPVTWAASGSYLGLDTGASNVSLASTISDPAGVALGLNKIGAGDLTLTGANTYSGTTVISRGRLFVTGSGLSPNTNLNLNGTAVFGPAGNLELPGGTGAGQMQITATTLAGAATTAVGFTNVTGSPITVDFGTAGTPENLTWGTAPFNPGTGSLKLNDAAATSTLTFSNPIDLNGASRTVTVDSSTAATAATLSGVLSGATGGLAKTGTGILNVTHTANSYAGPTTITTGTLSFNGGGSGPGGMALPSGTPVNVNGGTFQVLNDTAGTLAYGNTVNLGGTQTITVGNNGGATTGSTVAFGQLNAPATAVNTATTTTISSPNNYTTTFTGFALPGTTGATTILTANSNVIINGNVTNRMTGFVVSNFDTLQLQGTSTGSQITGIISDAAGGNPTAGGTTRIIKSGTGTWTLSGANTYTGTTDVNVGTLILLGSPGGTTVIGGSGKTNTTFTGTSVNGGTLLISSNVSIGLGNPSTFSVGQGTLNVGNTSAGTLSMLDSAINTLNINGNAATGATTFLTLGGATTAATLSLDAGNNMTDQIFVNPSSIGAASGKLVVGAGGAVVNLNQLPSTSLTTGNTYNLLNYANGGTFTGAFSLGSYNAPGQVYTLSQTGTALQLAVSAGAGSGNVYWRGNINSIWGTGSGTATTNFTSDYAGTISSVLPDATSNVFFTASPAAPANFATTTLGQGFAVNSLNIIGAAPTDTNPVGIGGTLPLTIHAAAGFNDQNVVPNAYAAGIGLVMQSGAAATTISAPVILGGNQTWQLDSANGLTSSGAVSGAFSLTKTGTGTLTLGGANTFSGGLTISNGTVIANVSNATTVSGAAGPSTSTITLGGAGNSVSLLANSFTVSNPVILGSVGADTATIGNNGTTTAAVFSGGVNLNGVDLTLTATGTTGTTTVSGLISGTGNLNYTPVVGTQVTVNQASFTGNTTLATAGTVNLNQTAASNAFSLLSTGQVNLSGGGILKVKGNGAGTSQLIVTGDGITGNNVVVAGNATLDVNNNGANVANAFVFNNLSINGSQLNVLGSNRYDLNFAGTTTLTGAATLNPTTAGLNLLGKVDDGGFGLAVAGTEYTRLLNSATGGAANSLGSGTITVNGGNLVGYAPATGAGTVGSNTLGAATIALTGTNPVVNLAPSLGATLTGGTAAGLLHKTVAGTGNPASVNWLGATITTTGVMANPTGSQTVANLNYANGTGTGNVGHQFTGLLNITTPGMYNFSALHDDGVSMVIDGVLVLSAAGNTTTTGSVYLPAGLHAFSHRLGQGTGGVGLILSYQGPDTSGALTVVPASAFSSASNLADLNTSFANNFTVSAGTSATLALAANTTVGTVTFGGTGATLNATGSNNITTLTTGAVTTSGISTLAPSTAVMIVPSVTGSVGGADTLVLNASLAASTTFTTGNLVAGVIANGASGGSLAVTKTGNGSWSLSGANTYTGPTLISEGTLQLGTGGTTGSLSPSSAITNNGTLAFYRTDTVTQGTDFASTIGGSGGLRQAGSGTLLLNGANTYTGNTVVAGGTLNLPTGGSLTGNGLTTSGSTLNVGTVAGQNAVVNVNGGNINTYYSFGLGTAANSVGVLNLSGGSYNGTGTQTNNSINFVGQAGYGYLNITGGTFAAKGRFAPSNGVGTTGVMYIGGTGTFDHTAGEWFLMAYSAGGNGGLSQVTVGPGGTLNRVGASQTFGLNMDRPNGYAVFSMAGGQMDNGVRAISFGNGNNTINTTGILNLAGGTLTVRVPMANNPGTGTGNTGYLNFAGGTLRTSAAVTAIIPASSAGQSITSTIYGAIDNSAVSGAPSFVGGLTVDTNGFNSSLTNALLAPAGMGVRQADLTLSGGAGYVGAPAVQFSKPAVGGSPASGYALISGGQVTGIVITSPGNYALNEVPTVTLTGGGASSPATVTVAALNTAATSGGLTKTGAGTLTLSGANTYTGDTTISASSGTLQIGGAGSLGGGTYAGGISIGTGSAFQYSSSAAQTLGGTISGAGALTKDTGTGTLTLSAANTYTGLTTLGGGVLRITKATSLGDTTAGTTQSGASALEIDGTGGAVIVGNEALQINGGGITNLGALRNIAGNNTYGGTVTLAAQSRINSDSGTLLLNNPTAVTGPFTLVAGGAGNITISGAMTNGAGGVAKDGAGILTLSGLSATAASNYTGTTTIDNGTVAITTTSPTLAGGLTFGTNASTLDLSGVASSATFAGALTVQTNSGTDNTILLGAAKTLTINGGITMGNNTDTAQTRLTMTGGGALVVNGASIIVGNNTAGTNSSSEAHLNLAALDSFTTTLSGSLTIQAVGDNSAADPSSITLSNGANSITAAAVRVGNSSTGSPNTLWLGGGTNLIQTDLINLGAGSRDTGIIDFAGSGGSVTLRNVAGTGRVGSVNLGPQTAQATGYTTANLIDLTGNTADIAMGTFATSLGAKAAANTNELRFDTGTLDIRSINMAVAKGTGASTNTITIGGGTVRLGGSAAFSDAGTGTVTLATAGSGELIINGGTVTTTASLLKGAGAGTAKVTLAGGTLDLTGQNIGSATGTVVLAAQSGTLKNVASINGAGGLTKTTSGTLTLDGTNGYTGDTNVADGTLLINGTTFAAGLISLSATATLGGSTGAGQTGSVDMLAGGFLRPGDTARSDNWMNVQDLSLDATTQLHFELGVPDNGGSSLPANDLVLAAGIPYLGGVINVAPLAGFAAAPVGSKWRLFGLTPGTVPASHNLSLDPALGTNYSIEAVTGADSVYLVLAIPEASTSGLVLLGLLLLRRLRRGRA